MNNIVEYADESSLVTVNENEARERLISSPAVGDTVTWGDQIMVIKSLSKMVATLAKGAAMSMSMGRITMSYTSIVMVDAGRLQTCFSVRMTPFFTAGVVILLPRPQWSVDGESIYPKIGDVIKIYNDQGISDKTLLFASTVAKAKSLNHTVTGNLTVKAVTRKGIITEPLRDNPFCGDQVWIPEGMPYPFNSPRGKNATISEVDGDVMDSCVGGASIHLTDRGYVSISGGPFEPIHRRHLAKNGISMVPVWNWGSDGAGANRGVQYGIPRPYWTLNNEALYLLMSGKDLRK